MLYPCIYRHDKEAENVAFVKGGTIVSRDLKDYLGRFNDGLLNTQVDKFD